MNDVWRNILQSIGNTSLVALRNVVPANGARILLKLENENPTGSMKDRMALAMIEAGEADGRLSADGSVVEYTGGRDMIEAARLIAARPGAFWTDQLNNKDQLSAYHHMAEEIWSQTDGHIDAFVQSVGTAASLRGTAEALRRHQAQIRIVAVEPSESPVLSGGQAGAHKIDGVGAGFIVPLWQKDIADQIEQVSTEDAVAMTLRLAREEGLFAGTSTGANVIAALRVADQFGPDATIVTVMCDTGMKYLSKLAH